jgi:hypothetical protein
MFQLVLLGFITKLRNVEETYTPILSAAGSCLLCRQVHFAILFPGPSIPAGMSRHSYFPAKANQVLVHNFVQNEGLLCPLSALSL